MMGKAKMITKIGIENFKAFGDYQEIEFNKLTLISGLNSSGKSSIYQALLLLAQSENKFISDRFNNKIPTLDINGDFIKFGTASDIMHDKSKKYVFFVLGWSDGTIVEYKYDLLNNAGSDSDLCGGDFALSQYTFSSDKTKEFEIIKHKSSWEVYANKCLVFGEYKIFEYIDSHINEQFDKETSHDDNEQADIYSDILTADVDDTVEYESYDYGTFMQQVNFNKEIGRAHV